MVPFALITRRTCRSVAPIACNIPIERIRRCARTVKPPIDTNAINSMPRTNAAREIVSGFSGLDWATEAGELIWTPLARECSDEPGASNSTVTFVGLVTCPGMTRANSSSRLCGFTTMPTTRRLTPPRREVPPTARWNSVATVLVTAISEALVGK